MERFTIGAISSFILFVFSLELRKDMGNVWYRIDSTNKKSLNFKSLFSFLSKPLTTKYFWNIKFIDLNWIVVSGLGGIMNVYIHKFIFKK